MGSETRQRKQLIQVRCTVDEATEIRAAASAAGYRSASEYVRDRASSTSGTTPRAKQTRVDRVELGRLLAELGKIGSNVNQLAKLANTSGSLPFRSDLAEVKAELMQMRNALMLALGRRNGD